MKGGGGRFQKGSLAHAKDCDRKDHSVSGNPKITNMARCKN